MISKLGKVAQEWLYCQQISVIDGFRCTLGKKLHTNNCFMYDYNKPDCENSVWKICRWLPVRSGKHTMSFRKLLWFLIIQPRFLKIWRKGGAVLRTIRRDGRPPTDTRIGTRLTGADFSTPDASNAPVIGHQRLHSKLLTTVSASM